MKRLFLLATLLLTACAPAPAAAPFGQAAPVRAVARVALSDTAGRRLLADLVGWQTSDVARVTLTVLQDGVAVLDPIVLEGAAISAPVAFTPLRGNVAYAVVGRAERRIDPDTWVAIDAYATDAATCTTTFTTRSSGVMQLDQPIRIQFGARPYAGDGSTKIHIDAGAVTDAETTPEISITAPYNQ